MNREGLLQLLAGLGLTSLTEQQIQDYAALFGANLDDQSAQGLPLDGGIPNMSELNVNTDITAPVVSSLATMKSDPTNFATDPTSALSSFDPQKEIMKSLVGGAIKSKLPSEQQFMNFGNFVGGTLQKHGTTNGESPNAAAIGGGLNGALSGFKMAGIGGGIIGAGLGATTAWAGAKEQQSAIDFQRQQEENARRLGATVSPTMYADGGEIKNQKISRSSRIFDSNKAQEIGKTKNDEPILSVIADDGNKYGIIRRKDGSYDFYDKDSDSINRNGLISKATSYYESMPSSITKDVLGFVSGMDNYRDYQRSYDGFASNPSIEGGIDTVYNAIMAAPIVGGVGKSGVKGFSMLPKLRKVAQSLGRDVIENGIDYVQDNVLNNPNEYLNSVQAQNYADGGEIMDGQGNLGIQTELGERMVLPNGDIVMVKADDLHKNMDDKKITDFVPEGSVVFSAKKEKKNLINPKDYEDEIMGYSAVHYDENNPKLSTLKEIKFGDVIGDKPLSPSEALEMIRKKYSTRDESVQDIFAEATNRENKKARMPYISMLVTEQAKNNGTAGAMQPQQFGYGGGVSVRKFGLGDEVYPNSKMSILNREYNLPITPKFQSMQVGDGVYPPVYTQEGGRIDPFKYLPSDIRYLPSNMIGGSYSMINNDQDNLQFNQGVTIPNLNYFNGGGASLPEHPPSEAFYDNATMQSISPLPSLPLPSQILSQKSISPPYVDTEMPTDPYAAKRLELATAQAMADITKMYPLAYGQLDKLEGTMNTNHENQLKQIEDVMSRKYGTAGATYGNELTTAAMQDPRVFGKFQTPYFNNEMFRGMSPSQLEQQTSQLRASANNTISSLIGQGLSTSQAVAAASPIMEASLQKEGEMRSNFYKENQALERSRYAALNGVRNTNDAETARVQQQTLTNQNAINARLGMANSNYLSQLDTIGDNGYALQNKENLNFTDNQQKLFNNRFNVTNQEGILNKAKAEWLNNQLQMAIMRDDMKEFMRLQKELAAENAKNPATTTTPSAGTVAPSQVPMRVSGANPNYYQGKLYDYRTPSFDPSIESIGGVNNLYQSMGY